MAQDNKNSEKKKYEFGGIKEFNLEEIESEVLNDSVYLDVFAGSDAVFKEDLKSLESPLEKILHLDGVSYNYKTNDYPDYNFPKQRQIGLIAQAVEKVFPELVMKNDAGHLLVNYAQLTPVLAEGIKQLNDKVEKQERQIEKLTQLVERLTSQGIPSPEEDGEEKSTTL
jgi:hypothetical protein